MITDTIKELRLEIDLTATLTKGLTESPKTIACKTELLMAKAWLGKLLGEYDVATPYQNEGKRKEVEDIEPTADVQAGMWSDEVSGATQKTTNIQKIDILRKMIGETIDKVKNLELNRGTWTANVSRTNCFTRLCQARFNLGFELERIREEAAKTDKKK